MMAVPTAETRRLLDYYNKVVWTDGLCHCYVLY